MLKVAVISDTHIPDRAEDLHPNLLPMLRSAQVAYILHAGDVCVSTVLTQLEEIAPVQAVYGNRDWLLRQKLPWIRRLVLDGVEVALLHGQGSFQEYFVDKWQMLAHGYQFSRYQGFMKKTIGDARVIIYGHTHVPENRIEEGRLWFNPGSACVTLARGGTPSFGLLTFSGDTFPQVEIIRLTGARLSGRRWIQ